MFPPIFRWILILISPRPRASCRECTRLHATTNSLERPPSTRKTTNSSRCTNRRIIEAAATLRTNTRGWWIIGRSSGCWIFSCCKLILVHRILTTIITPYVFFSVLLGYVYVNVWGFCPKVFKERQSKNKENQPEQNKMNNQRYHNNRYQQHGRDGNVGHHRGSQENRQQDSTQNPLNKKVYIPLQFENSLGKLQVFRLFFLIIIVFYAST